MPYAAVLWLSGNEAVQLVDLPFGLVRLVGWRAKAAAHVVPSDCRYRPFSLFLTATPTVVTDVSSPAVPLIANGEPVTVALLAGLETATDGGVVSVVPPLFTVNCFAGFVVGCWFSSS